MDLKEFSDSLKRRTNTEIETINSDDSDALSKTAQLIVVVEKCIHELKRFVLKYKFKSLDEEIEFFKVIKPDFTALLCYHRKVFQVQLFEAYNAPKVRLKYFRSELKRLESFIEKNREFYHYVLSDSSHFDDKYFTRRPDALGSAVIDDRFSTPYEMKFARILANRMVREYLLAAIQKIEKPASSINSSLTWTGSKTDLIELIYALQAAGVFNKKDADVKQIATQFENVFNLSLGNYYRVFQEIRQRKTGQVNFINQLRERLMERISQADS